MLQKGRDPPDLKTFLDGGDEPGRRVLLFVKQIIKRAIHG